MKTELVRMPEGLLATLTEIVTRIPGGAFPQVPWSESARLIEQLNRCERIEEVKDSDK